MKQKEKATVAGAGGGGASGALRIFSSFSRGKAGLRGDQLLATPRSHSDPVLLRVRRRAEEPAQAAVPQIRYK